MMTYELNWKRPLLGAMLLMGTYDVLAVTPGATQQAIGNIQPEATLTVPPKPIVKKPGKPLTKKQKQAIIDQLFKNPAFIDYFQQRLKHPYYSDTPKSVYTPVGTPMRWGGIGVASDTVTRYPSQTRNSYDTALSAALPFGNSETSIGGAIAVGTTQLGPIYQPGADTRLGEQGSVGITFSRWLAKSTIITAGVPNLMPWGPGYRLVAKSYYGGVTQVFGPTFQGAVHPVSASVGVGSGSFGPLGRLGANGIPTCLNDSKASAFANAAVNLTSDLALIGDYYSETFAAGISYKTVVVLPLNVMLYAANLHHSMAGPSTTVGLRIALGLPVPGQL